MKILKYSDVTSHNLYLNRRKFVESLGCTSLALVATPVAAKQSYSTTAKPNTIEEITNYNNFYEFGTSKTDPAKYAHSLTTNPWEITFEGISQNKKRLDIVEILKGKAIQERIYRLRCVEGWSMVIPWIGFPLRDLINELEVDNNTKVDYNTSTDTNESATARNGGIAPFTQVPSQAPPMRGRGRGISVLPSWMTDNPPPPPHSIQVPCTRSPCFRNSGTQGICKRSWQNMVSQFGYPPPPPHHHHHYPQYFSQSCLSLSFFFFFQQVVCQFPHFLFVSRRPPQVVLCRYLCPPPIRLL